jgi:hypothetical protein
MSHIRREQHRCIHAEVRKATRRWTGVLVLALAALLIPSRAHPQAGESAYMPDRFEYFEGHAYMGSDRVTWQNHRLAVVKRITDMTGSFAETVRQVDPHREAWERFWTRIDSLGVWRWKTEYNDPKRDAPDGESWSLRLRFGKKCLESKGYNAVPNDYSAFRDAVHKLTEDAC